MHGRRCGCTEKITVAEGASRQLQFLVLTGSILRILDLGPLKVLSSHKNTKVIYLTRTKVGPGLYKRSKRTRRTYDVQNYIVDYYSFNVPAGIGNHYYF